MMSPTDGLARCAKRSASSGASMAYVVELTVRALRDLDSIYDRIHAVESPSAAAWFDGLELAISGLQGFPHRCPPAPESLAAKRKLRQLFYGKKPHVYP